MRSKAMLIISSSFREDSGSAQRSRRLALCAAGLCIALGASPRAWAQEDGAAETPGTASPKPSDSAPSRPLDGESPRSESAPPEGVVSFYARRFAGRRTASGEVYDPQAMTMAHRSLPFGTWVRLTHLGNGQRVHVRVNDRGPWTGGRLADLSMAAARRLGMLGSGVARVRLEILGDPPAQP
jgi:rare lipoprotein A